MCIFIITGCKVEYKLKINDDLTVQESVTMTGTDEFFNNYYKSSRLNVINMLLNDERKKQLTENGYQYEIVEQTTPYVLATKKYNNIEEFSSKTIFFNQYFENLEVVNDEGIISIKTQDFIPINPDFIERYDIKTTKIEITVPFKVVSSNATRFDAKTNTYTWYISDETTDFSLDLSYNSNMMYEVPSDGWHPLMILGITILLIGLLTFYYVKQKQGTSGSKSKKS